MPNEERSMRERMLGGELYIADGPVLAQESQRAMTLSEAINRSSEIRPPFYCDYGYQTRVGARTFANFGLTILDVAPVTIGDEVQIGPQLLTAIVIVCPGVTVGRNSVVGAGSAVTKDLPADVLAVGSPARVVREPLVPVGG